MAVSRQGGTSTSPLGCVGACWAEVTLTTSCERMPKQAPAHPDPSHYSHPWTSTLSILIISSNTLSAVGPTGGVRMLGGDSGRFLCFCLRRSLSFRLWGGKGDQILMEGEFEGG